MLEYYYEKQYKIYKLRGKMHQRIILYKHNYYEHIKMEHPEMSITKIISILEDPDYIYKTSNNSRDIYYEKSNFRVVISDYKKHVKNVVTAYRLKANDEFDVKHTLCIYDKNTSKSDEQFKHGQEDDIDYFLDLFKES